MKNTEDKNKDQLDTIKDQGEKNLQILAKKAGQVNDVKNIFFRNKINFEALKFMINLTNKLKRLIIQKLSALAHQLGIKLILPSF